MSLGRPETGLILIPSARGQIRIVMPRRNRVTRQEIAAILGEPVVDEIERWNDRKLDSLSDFAVELDPIEVAAQNMALDSLKEKRTST